MPLNPLGSLFFPKIRKEVNLENYVPLRGRGDKNGNGGLLQKKLMISMELSDNVVGMPSWVGDAMDAISEDDAMISRIVFDNARLVMPGMTVEIYASRETKERALLLTGCEFSRFSMNRQGLAETTRFWLDWQLQCVDPLQLHEWLDTHLHRSFCIAVEQGQKVIDFATGEEAGAAKEQKAKEDDSQSTLAYDTEKSAAPTTSTATKKARVQ